MKTIKLYIGICFISIVSSCENSDYVDLPEELSDLVGNWMVVEAGYGIWHYPNSGYITKTFPEDSAGIIRFGPYGDFYSDEYFVRTHQYDHYNILELEDRFILDLDTIPIVQSSYHRNDDSQYRIEKNLERDMVIIYGTNCVAGCHFGLKKLED